MTVPPTDEELLSRPPVLPPASHPKSMFATFMDRFDLPFVLVLCLTAWSFGGYINTNWVVQNQADRISAQNERMLEIDKRLNQHNAWMKELQDKYVASNKETADQLAQINLKLAEIKGATSVKTTRGK